MKNALLDEFISNSEVQDLSEDQLLDIQGGVLPLIAVPAIIKGIGIEFTACAAAFGAIAIGMEMSKK